MKKLLSLLFICSLSLKVFSQGAPACPNVTAGPTQTVCKGISATLTSTLVTSYKTTSYNVSSIPYSPYGFTGTSILVSTDDVWSPAQGLLFPFCFFGNTYTQCVVGANGEITFDISKASAYEPWKITQNLPFAGGTSSTYNATANSICAAFRDIDPAYSPGGNVYYQTGGASPCRYVVISWVDVPLYSCKTPHSTFQCVLYENTNFIDVYIQNSAGSCGWNSGYGEIGIQNIGASVAVVPPGRNMSAWSAVNEAWRFTPTGAASYSFNWSGPAAPNFSTSTSVAVTPSVTSTYTASMVITNCDGTSFTTTATQQVIVNPSPTVTVNSPSACGGTPATLTAGGATTYVWTPATGLSGTTGASVSASPASTTVYSVTGTSGGCSTTVPATVTVVPNPTVTVNAVTVCAGTSATFTANGATTYSWSPATGLSATTGNIVTSTATSSITYNITGTTSGCTGSNSAILTVNPSPTVTVTNPSICSGNAATIVASGATTYTWSTGATGNSISVTPATTTSYTVTGGSLGCTNTAVSTVSVTPTPTVTVNNPTICPGGSAVLTASGATTYLWSTGATTNTISVSPGSTQTYSVTGSNGACSSSALATVTIGSGVAVSVPSATICTGASVVLTASGATTYTWSPATGLSATVGTSVTANPSTTQTYVITGASGVCTGTTSAVVTVTPKPTVIVPSGTMCAGDSFTLTATGGSTSYAWSPAT
ncbi:MAG: hypothetical protein ABI448_06015, partial [Bacteroidia bacterium]